MRTYTGRDIYQGLQETRRLLQGERAAWRQMASSVVKSLNDLPREEQAAWQHFGEVVVPALDARVLDDAAARLALPQVAAQAVAAARVRDEAKNTARLAEIERDPMFVEAEGRRNAAQIKLAELDEALAPLTQSTRALREEVDFEELIKLSYGTDRYAFKWWQSTYYRHWKHADLVVERHGARMGSDTFVGIREKYLQEEEAVRSLRQARQQEQQVLDAIAKLEEEHARAKQALGTLDARALAWARGRIREHLSALPADEMTRLVKDIPAWRVAGARVLGLAAKETYLKAMRHQVFIPFDEEAGSTLKDLDRKIQKASRPKKWSERVDSATYAKRIGRTRLDKWQKRRRDVDGARTSIQQFDRYDTYDPVREYLWWDVMTGGLRMPFDPAPDHEHSAVYWGARDRDDVHFAAAHASTRMHEPDHASDFS